MKSLVKQNFTEHQMVTNVSMQQPVVMIVDDDAVFRTMISGFLAKLGYEVMEAVNGLDGLQKLRVQVPDLVICDLSMPILNGIEFAEEVCWEYPSLPMIVVSATEEMSDVARALRFGIKDFLTKPITDLNHLKGAIENTMSDAEEIDAEQRDFASQWFRVDSNGQLPEEQELHWHLGELQENPNMARQLLEALLPDRDTTQGGWKCSYRLLQSSEQLPFVIDYAWVMEGQFVFYMVDASSGGESSVATTLLIRALFNDYLRNKAHELIDLKQMISTIEKGIACSDYAEPIKGLFGVADMTDGSITVASTGLECVWANGSINTHILPGTMMGAGCATTATFQQLNMLGGGQLNLNRLGSVSFSLNISPNTVN